MLTCRSHGGPWFRDALPISTKRLLGPLRRNRLWAASYLRGGNRSWAQKKKRHIARAPGYATVERRNPLSRRRMLTCRSHGGPWFRDALPISTKRLLGPLRRNRLWAASYLRGGNRSWAQEDAASKRRESRFRCAASWILPYNCLGATGSSIRGVCKYTATIVSGATHSPESTSASDRNARLPTGSTGRVVDEYRPSDCTPGTTGVVADPHPPPNCHLLAAVSVTSRKPLQPLLRAVDTSQHVEGMRVIDALKYVYSYDCIHADVKASMLFFRFGKGKENKAYLMEFALACWYTQNGRHKEYKENLRHTTAPSSSRIGTPTLVHTRRGDMEFLGYNPIQWLCCRLPREENLKDTEYTSANRRAVSWKTSTCYSRNASLLTTFHAALLGSCNTWLL
ncbi:hypothetical protein HPB50_028418 [Hyalomma asiaticum]|nr:hypothetical protein HPB50_028418 [Hyalomma asiaticum]